MMKSVIINTVSVTTHFGWRDMIRSFGYQQELLLKEYKELICTDSGKAWSKGSISSETMLNDVKIENIDIAQKLEGMISNIGILEKQAIETEKWIALLKQRGYKVYLCTSFPMTGIRGRLRDLAIELAEVDGQLVSEYKNMDTLSPDSYRRLLQMYGLKAEECIFIDDHMENIEAAKAEGMHTIIFNSYEEATDEIDRWMKEKVFEECTD